MWTILKVCIEFATILLLLRVLIFWGGHKAYGILVPRPGIEPALPALEGKVLTTGPPGKSQTLLYKGMIWKSLISLTLSPH